MLECHARWCVGLLLLCVALCRASGQQGSQPILRSPATPLVTHDPYFSLWSMADQLTDAPTKHWTGVSQPLNGLVRIDGKAYRYLGDADRAIPALEEVHRKITPTRTIVELRNPEVEFSITFLTPLFPDDLKVMSRPVTYLTWEVRSRDGREHDVQIYLDAGGTIATNDAGEPVVWSRAEIEGLRLLRIGSMHQPLLERSGDNLRINWGYFYIAVPQSEPGVQAMAGNQRYRQTFLTTGALPKSDDIGEPRAPQSRYPPAPALNVELSLGRIGKTLVSRHLMLAYDDLYSVEYMKRKLLPYWRTEFDSFSMLLQAAEQQYPALTARSEKYDAALESDLVQAGGSEYASIAVLAFRQAMAAHKLVQDSNGVPFFMPKENFSNGSISTVDVIYPSAPMFLLLNPDLVKAQLEPVLRYAGTSRWKFPFAPHDLGVYPLANGQLYGGGEESEENQMPVEESGDIILLVDAVAHAEGTADFAQRYWPLLTKWAAFLTEKGLDPENQLSTDDFAGHLAHNTNLSIKAIEAVAAYSELAELLGQHETAIHNKSVAVAMARKWMEMANDGDHYRLAFDRPGSWSQKYNLVWDRILGLQLFPEEVVLKETGFYKKHLNPFGLPLDERATYTKLDWEIWTATLTHSGDDFQTFVHPVFDFLNRTTDRVPMTDWYDTMTARQKGFQARSVVGGVYIKMLSDVSIWKKWNDLARAARSGSPSRVN